MTRRFRDTDRVEAFLRLSAVQFGQLADQIQDPQVRRWLMRQARMLKACATRLKQEEAGKCCGHVQSFESLPRAKKARTSTRPRGASQAQ
ncbi:MAG: hypothetical protein HY319_32650 [Armatimonadetes bacterium]|nr:hypothetical protein [Armatimonadota bacterium]